MSLFVRGDERFARNMPVRGIVPSMFGFNNLNSVLNPYLNPLGVNEVQFYSPFTGQLGPSFKPHNVINDMRRGFENNPFYNVVSYQFPNLAVEPVIKTLRYDNGKLNLGVIGTETDLTVLKKILDDYYARQGLAASADPVASPAAPPAAATAAATATAATATGPSLTVLPAGPSAARRTGTSYAAAARPGGPGRPAPAPLGP